MAPILFSKSNLLFDALSQVFGIFLFLFIVYSKLLAEIIIDLDIKLVFASSNFPVVIKLYIGIHAINMYMSLVTLKTFLELPVKNIVNFIIFIIVLCLIIEITKFT